MIKFLFILLIAFSIYLFANIDSAARLQIIKVTAAIPGKVEQAINTVGESIDNRLAWERGK